MATARRPWRSSSTRSRPRAEAVQRSCGAIAATLAIAGAAYFSPAQAGEKVPALAIPVPKVGLPTPYGSVKFAPASEEQRQYVQYLQQTALFPDQAVCDRALAKNFKKLVSPKSIKSVWVTKPFLAWGGTIGKKHANVGPITSLYSIIEAHVTFASRDGVEQRQTYSCAVQYAGIAERNIWRKGRIVYFGFGAEGHHKYQTGPAIPIGASPPGQPSEWEPGFRFYRSD